MDIKIEIGKKPFGRYKAYSRDALQSDHVVMVKFPGQNFIWIPSIDNIINIQKAITMCNKKNNKERIKKNRRKEKYGSGFKKQDLLYKWSEWIG